MTSSRRLEKINEELKTLLSKIIHGILSDPAHLVSVTHVETSTDLHHAKVFVSTFTKLTETLAELQQKKSVISQRLAAQMTTKFAPKIHFFPDDSIAYADQISRVINQANQDIPDSQEEL